MFVCLTVYTLYCSVTASVGVTKIILIKLSSSAALTAKQRRFCNDVNNMYAYAAVIVADSYIPCSF